MSVTARMHMASTLPPLTLGEAESPSVHQFHAYKLLQSFEVLIVQFYIVMPSTLKNYIFIHFAIYTCYKDIDKDITK